MNNLLTTLSTNLSQQVGKLEAYGMKAFEPGIAMSFAGTMASTCFVEIKNIGTMEDAKTQAMSQTFCQIIEEHLSIPPNRIYTEFTDVQGSMWGWNSRTF